MGASLGEDYRNHEIAKRNQEIIKYFATPLAQANFLTFKGKLDGKLKAEYRELIVEIPMDEEPYVDNYGRVTYFIIKLGD